MPAPRRRGRGRHRLPRHPLLADARGAVPRRGRRPGRGSEQARVPLLHNPQPGVLVGAAVD